MKILPTLFSVFLASVVGTQAFHAATLLTFDDESPFLYVMIPNGYHELQWNNFFIENGLNSPGFLRGAVSPPNVAFNGLGNPASVSRSTRFNLDSVYLTAIYVPSQQIRVEGFTGSTRTYNHTYVVSNTAPTLLSFNYKGIDRATFT